MRHSRLGLPVRGPGLTRLLGLVLLVGLSACGSPSPEAPRSGHTIGSADAVVVSSAGDAPSAGLAAHEPGRQAPTPTSPLRAPAPRTAPAFSPPPTQPDSLPPDAQTLAGQAQREARAQWFAELRESPDATVRLQALETWAQQPGEDSDPLTFALVDEDEDVRARAEELWEQQLAREEATAL